MAELDVRFAVAGLSAVTGGFATIAVEAKKAGATVAGASQQAAEATTRLGGSFTSARQVAGSFSSALSHAATVLSLTGGATAELAQRLQTAMIVVSSATVAIQALRGATLAWAQVMVIANTAMVALAAAATTIAGVLTAPFTLAAIAAGALVTTLVLLKPALLGFKDDIGAVSKEMDLATIRAAAWARAWAGLDSAFRLVRESAFGLRLELRGLLGVQDALEAQWRVGAAKITTEQDEAARRQAAAAKREGDALKTLADQLSETRMQRELGLIVSTNTAERARDIVDSLRRQAEFLRETTIDWAAFEAKANPAMKAAIDLFGKFVHPAEEGMTAAQGLGENLDEVAEAARQAARILGVDWAEALTLGRQALQLAKDEGIGLADALARLKFNRDFLKELGLVDSGMKKWFDTWEKFKFGLEDFNIDVAPSVGKALDPAIAKMEQLAAIAKEILVPAFTQIFTDILSSAKSFGESILDFFRNIVNDIIRMFAQFLALKVWTFLRPILFGLAAGGIVTGGLTPILAAQAGAVVSRPTLAMIGEGRQSEAVVPLPDNRSIPVKFMDGRQARGDGGREAIIHLTIHNVIGDPRALGIPTAGDIAGVIVNDVSRRGPTIAAIRVALGG